MADWINVHFPLEPSDALPPERKTVLVWLRDQALPFCGYVRYAAGDEACPYFVVYHGNERIGAEVVAWCDCLPEEGPDLPGAQMYSHYQPTARGKPARPAAAIAT